MITEHVCMYIRAEHDLHIQNIDVHIYVYIPVHVNPILYIYTSLQCIIHYIALHIEYWQPQVL